MELMINPKQKDQVLQGKKTSNIVHGLHTDKSLIKFLSENDKGNVKQFALAECLSLGFIQFIPKQRMIFFYIDSHWQRISQTVVDELVKSEGLQKEKQLWELIKKPFQGTLIQWGRVMPILDFNA